MSPSELIHRILRALTVRAEQCGPRTAGSVPAPDLSVSSRSFVFSGDVVDRERYVAAANELVEGTLRIFALNVVTGTTPQWNVDPKSGQLAPLVFGKTFNYRDEALVGDIKYLWELNRHLHLVTLAQAWRLSANRRYLDCIERHVTSWIEQCPYPRGPNWTSSLELGIRLINWSITWQLVGGSASTLFGGIDGEKFRDTWLRSVYQHLHFIRGHLSKYSSANNHLIGEAAGLFIGSVTWPLWDACRQWSREAHEILERETLLQNAPDGVNLEQAVSYQQFVLDFLLLAGLAGRANGRDFPDQYWKRIETMLEHLASIMDVAGHVPMIGDADDGFVVRMSQESDFCPYRSLLASGAILFNRKDFASKARQVDDKTRWLLGSSVESRFRELHLGGGLPPVRRAFPQGGYYILGCDFETEREVRALVDAGPLGYLSIAAHGHADALAMTLSVGGREFLIDPGTYAYHTQKQWRDYFRGTTAHNTVVVDEENQSVIGGNFMWLSKAQVRCEIWESNDAADRLVASHDGYLRLSDPVLHRREIILDKVSRRFRVTDTLECRGSHRVQCRWHFSELCDVELRDRTVVASSGGRRMILQVRNAEMGVVLERGKSNPPAGWISRRFDVKVPATTASAMMGINGTTSIVTEITYD